MGSDHDAVAIFLPPQLETPFLARKSPTSPRTLRPAYQSHIPVLRTELTCEWIQRISGKITQVKKRQIGFQSADLKLLRRRALQASAPRPQQSSGNKYGRPENWRGKCTTKAWPTKRYKETGKPSEKSECGHHGTAVAIISSFKP